MRRFLLPVWCLIALRMSAQEMEDPSAVKPYHAIVQTGIALQWFDKQFKSFTLSAERPLNLYNHIGIQTNLFFSEDPFAYRSISDESYEFGVFAKSFFHGRFTGRRSKTYIGPDIRFGRRVYNNPGFFGDPNIRRKAVTFKYMVRFGWQFHLGSAVLEFSLPIGMEKERLIENSLFDGNTTNNWFIMAPGLSLGIGL